MLGLQGTNSFVGVPLFGFTFFFFYFNSSFFKKKTVIFVPFLFTFGFILGCLFGVFMPHFILKVMESMSSQKMELSYPDMENP